MKLEFKFFLLTLLSGIPAFFLGPVIWPVSPHLGQAGIALLPSFRILYLLESLLFGLGVSFIILGWPLVKRINNKKSAIILYISISWLLISWWPHDNFHLSVGEGIRNIIFLEYIFHIPTMAATLIVIGSLLIDILHGVNSNISHQGKYKIE